MICDHGGNTVFQIQWVAGRGSKLAAFRQYNDLLCLQSHITHRLSTQWIGI